MDSSKLVGRSCVSHHSTEPLAQERDSGREKTMDNDFVAPTIGWKIYDTTLKPLDTR